MYVDNRHVIYVPLHQYICYTVPLKAADCHATAGHSCCFRKCLFGYKGRKREREIEREREREMSGSIHCGITHLFSSSCSKLSLVSFSEGEGNPSYFNWQVSRRECWKIQLEIHRRIRDISKMANTVTTLTR